MVVRNGFDWRPDRARAGSISLKSIKMNPHSLILIRPLPEAAAWPLIHPRPSPIVRSSAAMLCPSPQPHHPVPQRQPRRAPIQVTCAARPTPSIRLPSPSRAPLTLPWPLGVHMLWRLRSFPAEPRAPTSASGAGGARVPRLAAGQNRLTRPFLPLCCACTFQVFQAFQMYVAIISF
jgi:hypothetical protein